MASHGAETYDSDLGIRKHWKSMEVVSLRCGGELGMEPGKGHTTQGAEDSEQVAQEVGEEEGENRKSLSSEAKPLSCLHYGVYM